MDMANDNRVRPTKEGSDSEVELAVKKLYDRRERLQAAAARIEGVFRNVLNPKVAEQSSTPLATKEASPLVVELTKIIADLDETIAYLDRIADRCEL